MSQSGVRPGITRLKEARDLATALGPAVDTYVLSYRHSQQDWILIPGGGGGGGGTTNHAALLNLDYASAGHTGFAGTGVGNVFTQTNTFQQNVAVTGDVIVGDDVEVVGDVSAASLITRLITSLPNVDLTLNPGGTGNVLLEDSTPLRSATFDSSFPITGFRVGPTLTPGLWNLTVGDLKADTLRVVTFVADETRVERANQYWTKSYGILAATFTAPLSNGQSTTLTFEDAPSIAGALAANNDYVLFRRVEASSGLVVQQSWGQLTGYVNNGDGTQTWTFTLRSGDFNVQYVKGMTGVIFGSSGDAYIHLSVNDPTGAPYLKGREWTSNPYTPANHVTLWQVGELSGVGNPNYSPVGSGIYARVGNNAGRFFVIDDNALQLRGADIFLYNGGTKTVSISSANGTTKLGSNVDSSLTTGFEFNGATGAITIGSPSYAAAVTVYGQVVIKAGSSGYGNMTDRPTSLNGINPSEYNHLNSIQFGATVGATWGVNLNSIPTRFGTAPSGAGLYLTPTHLGYFNGALWKSWLAANGFFYFGGDSGAHLEWNGVDLRGIGTDGVTPQWYARSTDGKLYAGAGKTWLDTAGVNIAVQPSGSAEVIRFVQGGALAASIGYEWTAAPTPPLAGDGLIFRNSQSATRFAFLGGSRIVCEGGIEGAYLLTAGLLTASDAVINRIGNRDQALLVGGSSYSSHFNYQSAEDTYIRGGKAGSRVLINDGANQGNVGIGTGSPQRKLHVHGDSVRISTSTYTTGMDLGFDGSAAYLWNYQNANLLIGTNNQTVATFTPAGHLGVGGAPAARFHVVVPQDNVGLYVQNNPAANTSEAIARYNSLDNNWHLTLYTQHVGGSHVQWNWMQLITSTEYPVLSFQGGNTTVGSNAPNPLWRFNVVRGNGQISLNPDFSGVNYLSSYLGANTPGPLALFGSRVFVDAARFGIGTSFTPSSGADTTGAIGDFGWDNNYIYLKIGSGWRRVAHSAVP